jgi:hypothetical protein
MDRERAVRRTYSRTARERRHTEVLMAMMMGVCGVLHSDSQAQVAATSAKRGVRAIRAAMNADIPFPLPAGEEEE